MNEPIRDTAHSLLSVARNAIDLAKAELQVSALEAKGAVTKFTSAAALTYLAVVFAKIALLLLALTPLLLGSQPWQLVLASLSIPTAGALAAGLAARRAFHRHRNIRTETRGLMASEPPRKSVPPTPR